jgi:Cu-Zn family superoxide dismutase
VAWLTGDLRVVKLLDTPQAFAIEPDVSQESEDGSAFLSFVTDRVTLDEVDGRAVIIHALPDNFHNIPVGPNADQYTPNSDAATAATDATGNAGARVGCGVVE